MAIVTNTFLTFSAIGNREDLSDMIYNISPTDTPFMGAIGKTTATATNHEWQTDALAAAQANAKLEGDETSFTAVTVTARAANICQISSKAVLVSGTQDEVKKAGRTREMTYQLMKMSKELRNDQEFVLTNNQTPVNAASGTPPSATVARALRPLCSWYTTNDSRGASGADGSATAEATDGTQRALTESLCKTVMQNVWTAGGDVDMWMCGAFNKTVISGFSGNHTRTQDTVNKKLVTALDVYASDFGTHKIVANRFSRSRDLHMLDTSMWAMAVLRPTKTYDLAKTGDATKALVLTEYTLEARNQAASGIVADLTSS